MYIGWIVLGIITLLGLYYDYRKDIKKIEQEHAYLIDAKGQSELAKVICFYEVRKIHHQDKLRRNA